MNIIFDGCFWGGRERGVATSTRRLFESLVDLGSSHLVRALVPQRSVVSASAHQVLTIGPEPLAGLKRMFWQQLVLPGLLARERADLLVATCYTAPAIPAVPYVLVVHDLLARNRPTLCRPLARLNARVLLRWSVRRATLVFVPSEVIKAELLDYTGAPSERVQVLPWAVDRDLRPVPGEAARAQVRQRFALANDFVLFVGAIEPKKNLEPLIRACNRIAVQLVLVGPTTPEGRHLEPLIRRCPVARHLGYVSADQLSALYASAAAVVLPSTAEGYGMPAVEAMFCGAPVVASDIPTLKEVCAGAALHFASQDDDGLTRALERILGDRPLRTSLIAAGRARARALTWPGVARTFMQHIESVSRPTE